MLNNKTYWIVSRRRAGFQVFKSKTIAKISAKLSILFNLLKGLASAMLAKRVKGLLISFAKVAIAIIVLWFLVHSAQIKFELFVNFFHRPILFADVVLLFFIMIMLSAWRWHLLNTAQGIHLSYYNTAIATYVGGAFNNVLPGAIGGDFVRLYYIFKSAPHKKSYALLSIFSDRVIGFLAVFVTILIIAALRINQLTQEPKIFYLLSSCTIFCTGILLAFVLSMWLPQKIKLSARLNQRFGHKKWIKPIISFLDTVSVFRIEKVVIIKTLGISVLIQLLIGFTIMLIGKMMGLPPIAFSDYVITMGMTQIVNLLPITPGGVGIGEMAFANVLMILNPGVDAAFATIFFAYRVISIIAYLPSIIWYIPKINLLKKHNGLREEII